MRKAVLAVLLPVVGAEECLHMAPHALDGIGMSANTLINQADAMFDDGVHVTMCFTIVVCHPAITDYGSARFDPVTNNVDQGVSGSVHKQNEKCFSRLALNTAKHPLPLNRVAPVILVPSVLALIDFDGLVRSTDLLRSALQVHQQAFPAELASISNGTGPKVMPPLGNMASTRCHK
jgi:hypothetical protein